MGGFLKGHGDVLRGNTCIVGLDQKMDSGCGDPSSCTSPNPEDDESLKVVGRLYGGCQDSHVTLSDNKYFTPDGKAMFYCGQDGYSLEEMQEQFGLEVGSSQADIPSEDDMVEWARAMLFDKTLTMEASVY
jgi:hypothetical protein